MILKENITFVVAVNNDEVFRRNFLSSPCLASMPGAQIIEQKGFASASKAYNDGLDRALCDLVIFCHQDVLLPRTWPFQLQRALDQLAVLDPKWGVLGSYGKTSDGRGWGHVYSSGRAVIGEPLNRPVPVQTLDEIVIILRKSSGLRFDPNLPHFHFYGTDICLRAATEALQSYAISAYCIHNTQQLLVLPSEFYECGRYIKRAWHDCLPIQTTCVRITRYNLQLYEKKLREFYLRYIRNKTTGGRRINTPELLITEFGDRATPPALRAAAS